MGLATSYVAHRAALSHHEKKMDKKRAAEAVQAQKDAEDEARFRVMRDEFMASRAEKILAAMPEDATPQEMELAIKYGLDEYGRPRLTPPPPRPRTWRDNETLIGWLFIGGLTVYFLVFEWVAGLFGWGISAALAAGGGAALVYMAVFAGIPFGIAVAVSVRAELRRERERAEQRASAAA